jgi:Zn finger protein HypA/HybF involved in hydrogenase expression
MEILTTRDLRKFLADVMVDVRSGKVKPHEAQAIAKLSSQINQSLSIEVNAALRQGLEQGAYVEATPMRLAAPANSDSDGMIWCDQCDSRVELEDARSCKSPHCKAKAA